MVNFFLNICIHPWPPRIVSSQGLHFYHTRVALVELLQDLLSTSVWYYHSRSPEQASIFDAQFISLCMKQLVKGPSGRFVPDRTTWQTFERTGSFEVRLRISAVSTVMSPRWSIRWMMHPDVGTSRFSCKGRRLILSAATTFVPGL